MKIISFAWTTEALLLGTKTQTRRFWKDRYAKQFKQGDRVQAYDKNPRAKGKLVAIIRLTKAPYKQKLRAMTQGDFIAEGGYLYWSSREQFAGMMLTQGKHDEPWVIEFELLKVITPQPLDKGAPVR